MFVVVAAVAVAVFDCKELVAVVVVAAAAAAAVVVVGIAGRAAAVYDGLERV